MTRGGGPDSMGDGDKPLVNIGVLTLGLVLAIVGNVVIVVEDVTAWHSYSFGGNVAAIIVCAGAMWIIHHRELFQ